MAQSLMKFMYAKIIFLLIIGNFACKQMNAQTPNTEFNHVKGTFNDPRDGKTYKTITFRFMKGDTVIDRTWLAENLNFNQKKSYCYSNENNYCQKYGRLYDFEQAKTACPDGWLIPSITEWEYLFQFFGGMVVAIKHLTNENGMNMLYGGYGKNENTFRSIGKSGNWWDSELKGGYSAGVISFMKGSNYISHEVVDNSHKLSCRCVKINEN